MRRRAARWVVDDVRAKRGDDREAAYKIADVTRSWLTTASAKKAALDRMKKQADQLLARSEIDERY